MVWIQKLCGSGVCIRLSEYVPAEDGLADDMEFYKGKIKDMSDKTELLNKKKQQVGK